MGGESFSKMVWPKILKVYIWCAFGVASNGKSVKCWCGNSKVGVATATPAIRRAPPMPVGENQCKFLHEPAASGVNLIVWVIYGI